ncbi:alpha/beta hydrolase [Amycolatopsis sp. NPDC089917]
MSVPVRSHGIFGAYPNKCVEAAVNRYLLDGTLPAEDTFCAS